MAGARAGERGIAALADLAVFQENEVQIALVPEALFFSAVARLLSASSSVLREVAMFMRMWFSPPYPYDEPAFMCTFAALTR
jgi:hypothetical protein